MTGIEGILESNSSNSFFVNNSRKFGLSTGMVSFSDESFTGSKIKLSRFVNSFNFFPLIWQTSFLL